MRRSSEAGRFAERVLDGFDDAGSPEQVVIWIERKDGGVWAVGRAVNLHHRPSDEPRPDDYVFEGSKSSRYRQIGNAVPVRLATAIGAALLGAAGEFVYGI